MREVLYTGVSGAVTLGFSKNGLRVRIEQEGMEYVHLGALGDPKEGRDAARAGRFDQFLRILAFSDRASADQLKPHESVTSEVGSLSSAPSASQR